MSELSIKVNKEFCAECSLALRRFVGHMEGVKGVDVEVGKGKITISYDGSKISEAELFKISRESIEKLGYSLEKEEPGSS